MSNKPEAQQVVFAGAVLSASFTNAIESDHKKIIDMLSIIDKAAADDVEDGTQRVSILHKMMNMLTSCHHDTIEKQLPHTIVFIPTLIRDPQSKQETMHLEVHGGPNENVIRVILLLMEKMLAQKHRKLEKKDDRPR